MKDIEMREVGSGELEVNRKQTTHNRELPTLSSQTPCAIPWQFCSHGNQFRQDRR